MYVSARSLATVAKMNRPNTLLALSIEAVHKEHTTGWSSFFPTLSLASNETGRESEVSLDVVEVTTCPGTASSFHQFIIFFFAFFFFKLSDQVGKKCSFGYSEDLYV